METSSGPSCSTCGPWWQLPLLLVLVLGGVLLSRAGRDTTEPVAGPAEGSGGQTGETVSLAIDFGDRSPPHEYEDLAWREGMTVRDVLAGASGSVTFTQKGSGASAFLTQIDGVENEGAGGRNWTFAVNDEFGTRGFAVYPLRPGDRVLWNFAAQQ